MAINRVWFCKDRYRVNRVEASPSLSNSFSSSMAASMSFPCFLVFFLGFCLVGSVESRDFHELYQPSWAFDHFIYEGELLKLRLDNSSGTQNTQKIYSCSSFSNGLY